MTKIKNKLVLAAAAIVLSAIVMSAAILCHASATPYVLAGGLGIFLSILATTYIFQSVMRSIQITRPPVERPPRWL